jgi:hypothetical protein
MKRLNQVTSGIKAHSLVVLQTKHMHACEFRIIYDVARGDHSAGRQEVGLKACQLD